MDKAAVARIYRALSLSHWKEWNNAICWNKDGPRGCHTECSRSDREGKVSYIPYCGVYKQMIQNNLQNRKGLRKPTYGWWGGEGIVRDFGKIRYRLLYLKWITNEDLLYSIGNPAQCYVAAWMVGEFCGEGIHVYVCLSSFAVYLKLSQLVNQYVLCCA